MKMTKILALLGAVAATSAMANTISPTNIGFTPGVSITYGANHTSGEVHTGDGFTIYDVGGFTGVISMPAGWSFVVGAVGSIYDDTPVSIPGSGLINAGDSGEVNVTFTYSGAIIETVNGTTDLGRFVLGTTAVNQVSDTWASQDHELVVGAGAGGPATEHADNILVPASIPDGGATAMLLGVGILGLGMVRRKLS